MTVVGQWLTQYYILGCFPFLLNAGLLCGIGVATYLMLTKIADKSYNMLISLLPVLFLLRWQLRLDFVADGMVGLTLIMAALALSISYNGKVGCIVYPIVSTVLMYLLVGQWVMIYGILYAILSASSSKPIASPSDGHSSYSSALHHKAICWKSWIPLLLGGLLAYLTIRAGSGVSITNGIYSLRYQESQMQPDSMLHYVAIRFALCMAGVILLSWLFARLKSFQLGARLKSYPAWIVSAVAVVCGILFACPKPSDNQARWVDKINFLARNGDWDALVEACEGKNITGSMTMNYLNLALLHQGRLGYDLLKYPQKGSQSLLAGWNRNYASSVLLSDIHFAMGDIALSESYALEAITLARRGGSPRMMQRLVEICAIREDKPLMDKYLSLLGMMPCYKTWARSFRGKLDQKGHFSAERLVPMHAGADSLLSAYTLERIWQKHEEAHQQGSAAFNQTAWLYQGLSYLLDCRLNDFSKFITRTASLALSAGVELPLIFQEACLLLKAEGLESVTDISPSVEKDFMQFRQDLLQHSRSQEGAAYLQRKYAYSYWLYYLQTSHSSSHRGVRSSVSQTISPSGHSEN